jgi:membrane associated rhomboid family serine protease
MIPLKDENPSKTVPIFNVLLILANISVFMVQIFLAHGGAEPLFFRLGFIPYEVSHFTDSGPKNLVPLPLTIVTAMFLHGGLLHLLGNMLFLWIFGDNVEDKLGHLRYVFFYMMCGVMAFLVHGFLNINSQTPTIGASGAIAGVMGAYMFLFPRARVRTLFIFIVIVRIIRVPAIILLGYWILIQVFSGFGELESGADSGIAWFAHVGGFVTGLILITIMKKRGKRPYMRG